MAKYSHAYGGVGAPVGLTVFKTAGGSLGAVPGGFDSHTPLPRTFAIVVRSRINVEFTLILFLAWKKYASAFADVYSKRGISCSILCLTSQEMQRWPVLVPD